MTKTNNKRAAHGQRKPRRPRWAPAVNTMGMARTRASRATDAEIARYLAPPRASLDAMRQGAGRAEHVRILFALYWMGSALDATGGISGLAEEFDRYGATLDEIWSRRDTAGRVAATVQELTTLSNGLALIDAQLLNCTWGEFMKATELARALCRQQGGTVRSGDEAAAMVAKVMEGGLA